jgi:hypothetical protein
MYVGMSPWAEAKGLYCSFEETLRLRRNASSDNTFANYWLESGWEAG